jgi:hypothetical protein
LLMFLTRGFVEKATKLFHFYCVPNKTFLSE